MTDRLHSCKESPDGRHQFARRRDGRRCVFCEYREFGAQSPIRGDDGVMLVGWNVPAHDPDAHVGDKEAFWQDLGRP